MVILKESFITPLAAHSEIRLACGLEVATANAHIGPMAGTGGTSAASMARKTGNQASDSAGSGTL